MITDTYEQEMCERRIKAFEKLRSWKHKSCKHDSCKECNGTGRKLNGMPCIHMISCDCERCSPSMMKVENNDNCTLNIR